MIAARETEAGNSQSLASTGARQANPDISREEVGGTAVRRVNTGV
jgi:hypothetical protein